MEQLTDAAIRLVGSHVAPNKDLHQSTINYIKELLTPYAQTAVITDRNELEKWIRQALPGELGKHGISEMNKAYIKTQRANKNKYGKPPILAGAEALIEYLQAEIIELAGNKATDNRSNIILPFDIINILAKDEELKEMFNITCPEGFCELPFKIKNYDFIGDEELVMGLLAASDMPANGTPLNLELFGVPVRYNVLVSGGYLSEEKINIAKYKIVCGGKYPVTYYFNSPRFVQGLISPAYWNNQDHHLYWDHLYERQNNDTYIEVTF